MPEESEEIEETDEIEEPEEPEMQGELSVSIYAAYPGDEPQYGNTVQLLSLVMGASQGAQLNYQWQYHVEGGDWTDVPGANGETYEYVLDEQNVGYTWRLVVVPVQAAE